MSPECPRFTGCRLCNDCNRNYGLGLYRIFRHPIHPVRGRIMAIEVLRTVSIVSGIGVFLAALLTWQSVTCLIMVCARLPLIKKGSWSQGRKSPAGQPFAERYFIPSACGPGSCGLCKVKSDIRERACPFYRNPFSPRRSWRIM